MSDSFEFSDLEDHHHAAVLAALAPVALGAQHDDLGAHGAFADSAPAETANAAAAAAVAPVDVVARDHWFAWATVATVAFSILFALFLTWLLRDDVKPIQRDVAPDPVLYWVAVAPVRTVTPDGGMANLSVSLGVQDSSEGRELSAASPLIHAAIANTLQGLAVNDINGDLGAEGMVQALHQNLNRELKRVDLPRVQKVAIDEMVMARKAMNR